MIKLRLLIMMSLFSAAMFLPPANALATPAINFVSITDLHFDPFISCRGEQPCVLIQKLQAAPVVAWAALLNQYDHYVSHYQEDSSYPLIMRSLAMAKQIAISKRAQFVLVSGDFLGHQFNSNYQQYSENKNKQAYQAFLHKTLLFLAMELMHTFPQLPIYPVIGNNDSYEGDYLSTVHGAFFKDMSIAWRPLIKDKNPTLLQHDFLMGGYYAVTLPKQPHLKLIVLNTNFFSIKVKDKDHAVHAAATQELAWLKDTLEAAEKAHQKVFIAMHIPLGIDVYASLRLRLFTILSLWRAQPTKQFYTIVQTHANIISAIFAAHLHSDWFQLLTWDKLPDIPIVATPSISPIFGNNPGIKVFSYHPITGQLIGFITYYYPLQTLKKWSIQENFSRIYADNCHTCPLIKNNNLIPSERWQAFYWCSIKQRDQLDQQACSN